MEATRRSEPADLLDDDEAGDPAAPEKAPPRLGPMPRDARLWTSDPLEWAPLDEWDAEERAIALGARALSDVESSEATTRGMATWVRRSGSGQWGAAPGRLHLGGMTLPYCGGADASECGLGMAPGRRLDYRAWRWRFNELQRQGRQVDIRARLEERAAAIRARRDAVRRRGGGSE